MSTALPVFGLRPRRELRSRTRKLPKPRSSIFSPLLREAVMLSKIISTRASASFLVMSASLATFSTRSALVIVSSPQRQNVQTKQDQFLLWLSESSRLFAGCSVCFGVRVFLGRFFTLGHAPALRFLVRTFRLSFS